MYTIKIDEDIFNSLDSATRRAFASDYMYSASVNQQDISILSADEILRGDVVDTYYLPVVDLKNKLFTIGEFDATQQILSSDFVFVDKKVLQNILLAADPIILAMYFGIDINDIEEFKFSDDLINTASTTIVGNTSIPAAPVQPVLKQLTYDAVKAKTLDLIAVNGSTTTLDVKMGLRADNYRADQAEVSTFVKEVARVEGLDFNATTTNGNSHIVYTK